MRDVFIAVIYLLVMAALIKNIKQDDAIEQLRQECRQEQPK